MYRPLLLMMLSLSVTLSACTTPPQQPSSPQTPESITNPQNPWSAYFSTEESLDAWTVTPNDGAAPFLLVQRDGKGVGVVELFQNSLEQHPEFAQALHDLALKPNQIDFENGDHPEKLRSALEKVVTAMYQTIAQDWKKGHPSYTFQGDTPVPFQIGSLPGLKYSFQFTDSGGKVQHQQLGYITFDGQDLYLMTASAPYEATAFQKVQDLQDFQPYLDRVITKLRLKAFNPS